MTEERRDPFARGVSIVAALGINGSLFASILLMGMQAPQPEPGVGVYRLHRTRPQE